MRSPEPCSRSRPVLRRIHAAAAVLGLLLLLWLPVEDVQITNVLVFAALISSLATARLLVQWQERKPFPWYWLSLIGLGAGCAVPLLAFLLMAFKSGVHGHGAPDFTPAQVTAVLQSTPAWVIAGLLAALGGVLWRRSRQEQ